MRILMIDDDEVGMSGLQRLLRESGNNHTVDFATQLIKAQELLRSNDYDAVILDIMFPYGEVRAEAYDVDHMNAGLALLRDLRRGTFKRNAKVEVTVYTAKTADEDLPTKLAELGVDDDHLFYKPGKALDIVELLAR
jgi:CheY-like chemotaxis protein